MFKLYVLTNVNLYKSKTRVKNLNNNNIINYSN